MECHIVDSSGGFFVLNGGLLKRKRLERSWSQSELAKKFEKPKQSATVCQWETGKSTPTLADFKELCLILQVNPADLLGVEEVEVVDQEESIRVTEDWHDPKRNGK